MMTDADGLLAGRFAATRDTYNDADWNDVLLRRPPRRTRARALLVAAAIVAAIAVVALATPLGAAIVHGVGGFSAWLTGQPGSPVSRPEQRAFDRANSRSWLGFPVGTKLRRLVTVSDLPHGRTVDLLGFRSGSTLCLQIVVSGKTRTSTMSCAPLAELRHSISPVHPVLVDSSFGKGTKRAWYGVDRYQATAIQVTAGIAADGVRNVIVEDDSGRHTLRAESNAFLYVASDPEVGQRITHIWARTAKALVPVPFAPAPFGFGGGVTEQGEAIAGPTKVERDVRNGTIGWLDRREPRGEPLDVLLSRAEPSIIRRHAVFGRVLAPDPSLPVRLAVTLSTSRHGGKATGLCSWLIRQGGSGGGCAVRADLFAENPITADTSLMSGSDEFETVSGLASDDVSEIEAFFASGPSIQVPLADNAFIVNVPRARLPFRLIAYDNDHRVIGILTPPDIAFGGPSPAPGRARPLLRAVSSNRANAELSAGKSTGGGRCIYVRYDTDSANGSMTDCREATKDGPALLLGTLGRPAQFVMGRVRSDVATVELRFADGTRATIDPTRGFVLYGVATAHLGNGHQLVEAVARDVSGRMIGFEPFGKARN